MEINKVYINIRKNIMSFSLYHGLDMFIKEIIPSLKVIIITIMRSILNCLLCINYDEKIGDQQS